MHIIHERATTLANSHLVRSSESAWGLTDGFDSGYALRQAAHFSIFTSFFPQASPPLSQLTHSYVINSLTAFKPYNGRGKTSLERSDFFVLVIYSLRLFHFIFTPSGLLGMAFLAIKTAAVSNEENLSVISARTLVNTAVECRGEKTKRTRAGTQRRCSICMSLGNYIDETRACRSRNVCTRVL